MNELERAAHDLVSRPAAAPSSMAELERRAGDLRRRQQSTRVMAVAAAFLVLLAGVAGAAALRRDGDTDVQAAGSTRAASGLTQFDVTWSGDASVSDALAGLIRARLTGYGATEVSVASAGERRLAVSAKGITYDSASLLVRTKGVLSVASFARASSADACQVSATTPLVVRSVGWPVSKSMDTCFTAGAAAESLGSTVVVPKAGGPTEGLKALRQGAPGPVDDGTLTSVQVRVPRAAGGATRMTFGVCGQSNPPQCAGLLLDGVLMREPDTAGFAPPGEKPALEDAPDGFVVRGFTNDEARIFAAVVNSGAHQLDLVIAGKGEGEVAMPTTAAPGSIVTTTSVADADLVDVFVAAQPIRRGTSAADAIASGAIKVSKIPRQFYPSTAIQSADAINAKVALFEIAANTVIVDGMFVDCGCETNPTVTSGPSTTAPHNATTSTTETPPTSSAPTSTASDGTVMVFVVKTDVRRGTSAATAIATGQIVLQPVAAKYVPSTAITSAATLTGKVALFDLAAGTILVEGSFVSA